MPEHCGEQIEIASPVLNWRGARTTNLSTPAARVASESWGVAHLKILFVHQSYPAQFVHLAVALDERGDQLAAICRKNKKASIGSRGKQVASLAHYVPKRGNTKGLPPLLRETETKALRGLWVAETAMKLREQGYRPDLIVAHPGWGESLFLKDVWPACPQLHYLEFDYGRKVDTNFDPEFDSKEDLDVVIAQRMKTVAASLCFPSMSWGYTPTRFQLSTLPSAFRERVSVIHDGIDCQQLRPNPAATLRLPDGTLFRHGDQVLTFVNRTFEPYRGIHKLMRALPALQQRWPELQVLLIGSDTPRVSYGRDREDGRGWLAAMRAELEGHLDWRRIHVPGALSHADFIRAMQISSVHVYLTYPFVLSWSLLEAMACGAIVVGSATAPVQEVIRHGHNGWLVDFHDQDDLVATVSNVLAAPNSLAFMRSNARLTIKRNFRLESCLDKQIRLLDAVASGVIG